MTSLIDGDFDTAINSIATTGLSAKDMNKLVNPVMNKANKDLKIGLKEVQKAAFDELNTARKALQKTIRKDIKVMKKDMMKEVALIAKEVEAIIVADT